MNAAPPASRSPQHSVLPARPAVRHWAGAAGVIVRSLRVGERREAERRVVTAGGVEGDLYEPPGDAGPPLVLVPGGTPQGRGDRRVVAAAVALARAGRSVFVPELVLYGQNVKPEDVERIAAAAEALAGNDSGQDAKVALVGFSYGGALALLAAADPRLRSRLAVVAVFGAYLDFVAVIQAVTTGVDVVAGQAHSWKPDPRAPQMMREHAPDFAPQEHRHAVRAALAGEVDPGALPDAARAVVELFTNDDPARTRPLFARLDAGIRRSTERISPVSVEGRLDAPLLAMHSRTDPAVPYGEALRLGRHFPAARLETLDVFNHVDFRPSWREAPAMARDLARVWRFTALVLAAQD